MSITALSLSLLAGTSPIAAVPIYAEDKIPVKVALAAEEKPVGAGETVDDGQSEKDIIVIGRRRQETAQEVPLAISVIGAEQVNATGNFNVGRLQQITPTLQFYSSNPRNSSVNIRGLGAPFGLTSDGFEQGVGIYVDDVYYARAAASTFDFLDLAQIEVLRGPQGTLYGKNTTAGAINITTNQPTFNFEGRAEVTVGNLNFKQFKAAISGPLSDNVAARLAISSTSRRGTIFNVTSGNWINEQDNIGIRGQLLFKPSDTLSLTLSGDYSDQNPECCGTVYVRTGATQRPLNRQYASLAKAQGHQVVSTNPFDRLTDIDANLSAGNKLGGAALRAKWDVGPGTLTSVTAWRFWDWKPENDRDFTGLPVVSKSQNPSQHNQYTQEFRYNYSAKDISFVVGAFGFYQRIDTQGTEQHGRASSRWSLNPGASVAPGAAGCGPTATNKLACDPTVLDGLVARNTQFLKNTSAALFGQLEWKILPGLTVQPGARVNYDKKEGLYQRRVFDASGAELICPAPAADIRKVAQCSIFQQQLSTPNLSDWNFSYDLTLSYQVAPRILAYGTYAKSFKTAGLNQNGLPTDANNVPIYDAATIKPESVNHFELGLKTQLFDRAATLNLSAFRTSIDDYQATVTNGQLGVLRGYLANAEKVRVQGIEADFSIRPSERFTAYVNGAYTDAKYIKFVDAPCPPELSGGTTAAVGQTASPKGTPGGISPRNCDISGQELPGVSKWAFSYGAEGNVPAGLFGKDGQIYLGVDLTSRSKFSSNASPSDYMWVDGYTLTNFRAGFRSQGFNIYGWLRNAFDTNYFEQLTAGPSSTGLIVGQPGDQRTWGLTISASF